MAPRKKIRLVDALITKAVYYQIDQSENQSLLFQPYNWKRPCSERARRDQRDENLTNDLM